MDSSKKILIVDDDAVNREILRSILTDEYEVIMAENGKDALLALAKSKTAIAGIILDLIMPVMDGFTFMREMTNFPEFSSIPIVVSTGENDVENEKKSLELGAWDFISKPFDAEILKFRLNNAIERSQLTAFNQLKYLAEFDSLTGIYSKAKLLATVAELVNAYPKESFAFIRFDVERFQLVNSFYGTSMGDELLRYIARELQNCMSSYNHKVFGRIEGDVFGICLPYTGERQIKKLADFWRDVLMDFPLDFNLVPAFGVYLITDIHEEPHLILDKANLAVKKIKGNYLINYAFYSQDLSKNLEREQRIVNEMNSALSQKQFDIYLQPRYNLNTGKPEGAEALVRWFHPERGMIPPGDFIPVFERNGFITKLDQFVWEKCCILLRKWLDAGLKPFPISTNISRVDIYSPNFIDTICNLTKKYKIPNSLLHLELTESAYADDSLFICNCMQQLRQKGFIVLMDDFGSDYSSLNILKDIEVDILKIDMHFLDTSKNKDRGKKILESVVHMAKELHIPVVMEGAEEKEQVEFLSSIGCEYVQGYFFSRPIPVPEYEKLQGYKKVAAKGSKENAK